MDFIWIYIDTPSYWYKTGIFNELEYSIKSIQKNFKGKARCFVVGDDPKLYDLGINYIPHKRIESSKYGYHRHFDMLSKLQTALFVTKSDEFILMYDDIYLLKPVSVRDLTKVYAKSRITNINDYLNIRKGDSSYVRCWSSTYNRIQEFREDLCDWETHLPRYYDVDKFEMIIDKYNLERVAYLIFSLYAAEFGGTPFIVTDAVQRDVVQDRPLHNDYEKDFNATFMNLSNEGITPYVRNKMKELFDSN